MKVYENWNVSTAGQMHPRLHLCSNSKSVMLLRSQYYSVLTYKMTHSKSNLIYKSIPIGMKMSVGRDVHVPDESFV